MGIGAGIPLENLHVYAHSPQAEDQSNDGRWPMGQEIQNISCLLRCHRQKRPRVLRADILTRQFHGGARATPAKFERVCVESN